MTVVVEPKKKTENTAPAPAPAAESSSAAKVDAGAGYDAQTKALEPVTGNNSYKKTGGDHKWDGEEVNRSRGIGMGRGNDEGDNIQQKKDEEGNPVFDENGKPVMEDAPANAAMPLANNVKHWDSSDIAKNNSLGDKKTGAYTETFAGKAGKTSGPNEYSVKYKPGEGPETTFAEAKGAVGAGAKIGYKAGVGKEDGNNANFDIHMGANAGASGSAKLDHTGATAEGAASATADLVNISGNADAQKQWKVKGVSDPVKVGVGVSGSARVFAEAGIGAKAGISKDFIGVEGEAGAFVGAEAKADVHGTLGPVGGKVEASALAGAGIGAKGGITYKNGKIRISGQIWAAYGYGAKVGGEVEIDVKQAVEMGIVAAKQVHQWLDEDGDGHVSLNDVATKTSKGAQNAANSVDKGVDSFISATDTDGDGKFTMTDARALGNQAVDYGKKKVDEGIEGAKDMGRAAIEKGKELGNSALKKGEELYEGAKDMGNTALQKGKEAYEAIDTPEERAALIEKGKQKAYEMGTNAVNTVVTKGQEAFDYGKATMESAKKKMSQLKDSAIDTATDTAKAIRDYDYEGAAHAAKDKLIETGEAAKDKLIETGEAAVDKAEELVDKGVKLAEQGAEEVQKAAQKVEDGVKTAYETLTDEAKRKEALAKAKKYAAWKARQAAIAAENAKKEALKKAQEAKAWAEKKAKEAKAEAIRLAAEAKKAVQNAPAAVKKKVSETYSSAKKEVSKAYNTAKEGLSKAGSTLHGAGAKLYNYLF